MQNMEIEDFKISLKIMDSSTNQQLAKEKKELTILPYETKLKDISYLTSCYSNASFIKHDDNSIPFFEDIVSIFIRDCLQSAINDASIFITTPEGTYPIIEINKKPIDSTHPGITLQRIEQHLQIYTNKYYELIIERIKAFLVKNQMFFVLGDNLVNSPVKEVW